MIDEYFMEMVMLMEMFMKMEMFSSPRICY